MANLSGKGSVSCNVEVGSSFGFGLGKGFASFDISKYST